MSRGGRRRRFIMRGEARVWCPGGRWGPRRTRTNECWATLRAEQLYTALLRDNSFAVRPGARGRATYTVEDRSVTVTWEIRANSVWRRGRVFWGCSRCGQRCTRLYIPLENSEPACRRCWGLTYASRTLQNYKNTIWGRGMFARMFGTSQRDWAFTTTYENRQRRRDMSRERWEERRELLVPTSAKWR